MIKDQNEMKELLKHEFGDKPPSLFAKGVMRKNTKSVLADVLKSNVTPLSVLLRNPYHVIDGGQLLYLIKWSTGHTYDQECDMYVRQVFDNFGTDITVIFDRYLEAMSTKVAEQQRRATQNTSPDIIFELDMTVSTLQNRFLANRRNNLLDT